MTLSLSTLSCWSACRLELALACTSADGEYDCVMDGMRKAGRMSSFCCGDVILSYDLRVKVAMADCNVAAASCEGLVVEGFLV